MKSLVLASLAVLLLAGVSQGLVSSTNAGGDEAPAPVQHWIYMSSQTDYEIYSRPNASATHPLCASIHFNETGNVTGWDTLKVKGHQSTCPSDQLQAYACGLGEGLTAGVKTAQAYDNLYTSSYQAPRNLTQWMDNNTAWMNAQISALAATDPYWYNVDLVANHQFDGLLKGLNVNRQEGGSPRVTRQTLMLLNTQGDQMDLGQALNPNSQPGTSLASFLGGEAKSSKFKKESPSQKASRYAQWFGQHSHCSSLVGLAPGNQDLYIGHATWGLYSMMMRVFKTYALDFKDPKAGSTPGKVVTFSSYPGVLVSIDDYYTTSAGLAVTETSFTTFNSSLYKALKPQTVLYWLRAAVSNRMTESGAAWTETFGRYNSGTYNAQWNILDFKLFTPGRDLPRGTFWISEQFPGLYFRQDKTLTLASGQVWGSFNIPSNRTLFELSGTKHMEATQGKAMNSWQQNVRSQMWRRDGYQVSRHGLDRFMQEMQYNNYQHDPLSQGQPTYAIAARGDLGPGASCWGAIDAKVTSYTLWKSSRNNQTQDGRGGFEKNQMMAAAPSYVYNGPTPQQGVFQFSATSPHAMMCTQTPPPGLVNSYNFSWALMR